MLVLEDRAQLLNAVVGVVVHRIAVAFGGQGQMPLSFGDLGKGFVHVLDEQAFDILLAELDTISDLFGYLGAKESYLLSGSQVLVEGREEDLLAVLKRERETGQ